MRSSGAPAPNFRVENQFILSCARTRLGPSKAEFLRELLRQELDWLYVVQTALDHGIGPLVYGHLSALDAEAVPVTWMEFLRIVFRDHMCRTLDLGAQLLRLLEIFEFHGILAIPYKGPALALLAYGNLAVRDFADLDFLVRPQDIAKASELLISERYTPEFELSVAREASSQRVPGQYMFTRDGNRGIVELHTPLTLRYYPVPLDFERMSRRLEPVTLGGREIRTFSPEDSLILVSVHSSKHFWDRLKWVCDVAELVQIARGINWELAQEEAWRLGCERMLLLGLCLAHDLLDAPLPEEVLRRVRGNRAVQLLAAQVRGRLFERGRGVRGVVQRLFFRSRTRGNPWQGVRYCIRLATSPTEEDWETPHASGWLYPLLRPLRLARKYGLGLGCRFEPDLAPFVPTPPEVVERMLALAEVESGDVLYDLGCGDGRIVVTAAKRFGVRGVGVDIDPRRIAEANSLARTEGVEHLVRFVLQGAKTVDVSEATVVTLYLTLPGNVNLRQRLMEQLRPGARIVSREFGMGDWLPEKTETFETPRGIRKTLYLWRIEKPAQAGLPDRDFASGAAGATARH